MKIYLSSYGDQKYYENLRRMTQMGNFEGFDGLFMFTENDILNTDFYNNNKDILNTPRGGGLWAWKPYLLLKAFEQIDNGDVIFYIDSDCVFLGGTKKFLRNLCQIEDTVISTCFFNQKDYTKRDCFHFMDCDSEEYWNAYQRTGGILALKKTDFNIKLLQEWLYYVQNINIISDLSNICGKPNFESFRDHRHDQSILTNLCVKHKIKPITAIRTHVGVSFENIINYPNQQKQQELFSLKKS
jgi:hypothetical protein